MNRNIIQLLFFIVIFPFTSASQSPDLMQDSTRYRDSIRARSLYSEGIRDIRDQGLHFQALDKFEESLNIRKRLYKNEIYKLRIIYSAIGIAYKNLGNYDLALQNLLMAEQVYATKYDSTNLRFAAIYYNIGNVYRMQLDYPEALNYYTQAANIYKNRELPDLNLVAYANYGCAEVNYLMNNFSIARQIITENIDDADDYDKFLYYDLLAVVNKNLNNIDEAKDNFRTAIELCKSYYQNEAVLPIASEYLNYAWFLIETNKFLEASDALNSAFQIIKKHQPTRGTHLASYYRINGYYLEKHPVETENIERFFIEKKLKLSAAIDNYKHGLFALNVSDDVFSDEPPTEVNYLSLIDCLNLFRLIGANYLELAKINKTYDTDDYLESILNALTSFKTIGNLIQKARREITNEESKMQLSNLENSSFLKIIQTSYEAYSITKDSKYIDLAFKNAERLKSSSVVEQISDQLARQNSIVPDSLIQQEKKLNVKITFLKEQIFKENNYDSPDSTKMKQMRNELFHATKDRTDLNRILETQYSEFYNLKYADLSLGFSEIQSKLKRNEILIEYVLNESDSIPELYTFVITTDDYKLVKNNIDSTFLLNIENVYNFTSNNKYKYTRGNESKQFCTASNELFKTLIAEADFDYNEKKLIIVPDGKLNYIAFDALLEMLPDTTKRIQFNHLDYLIKKSCINYTYSSNLLFQFEALSNRKKNNILAFAPEYSNNTYYSENTQLQFMDLPGVKKEVQLISETLKTIIFEGEEATEKNFRSNCSDYDILHLAMHAFINDSIPAFSRLAFSQKNKNDLQDDGLLSTTDIYNLNLNARLTVLSACNTGTGKLSKGEGVISLARGFLYAGCPSIIMTLWEVEDNSGMQIMSSFYKNLKKGKPKDEALRNAKLSYLANSNSRLSHPHYWLNYVSIGDNASLYRSYDLYFFALLILGGVGLLLVQIIRTKKARKNGL